MVLAERDSEVHHRPQPPDGCGRHWPRSARRFRDPGDVAALSGFLASPAASYLTGQALCTNGGAVLH
jgi:NAD(P)-dependent dehydrogenase (short-subunit alcohol dehydrogenase family)